MKPWPGQSAGRAASLAIAAAIVAAGCGGHSPSPEQTFVARADAICAQMPAGPPGSPDGADLRTALVASTHQFADRFDRSAAGLRALSPPPGPGGAAARAYVAAISRVAVAVRRLASAADHYRPADPTDTLAVGRSFNELDAAAAGVDRRARAADLAAAGSGYRRCGHLRSGPAPPPVLATDASPPASLSAAGRRQFALGRSLVNADGCLACHRIAVAGNRGPGPDLSAIGTRLPPAAIDRALRQPTAPMPSFGALPPGELQALVAFLAALGRP